MTVQTRQYSRLRSSWLRVCMRSRSRPDDKVDTNTMSTNHGGVCLINRDRLHARLVNTSQYQTFEHVTVILYTAQALSHCLSSFIDRIQPRRHRPSLMSSWIYWTTSTFICTLQLTLTRSDFRRCWRWTISYRSSSHRHTQLDINSMSSSSGPILWCRRPLCRTIPWWVCIAPINTTRVFIRVARVGRLATMTLSTIFSNRTSYAVCLMMSLN